MLLENHPLVQETLGEAIKSELYPTNFFLKLSRASMRQNCLACYNSSGYDYFKRVIQERLAKEEMSNRIIDRRLAEYLVSKCNICFEQKAPVPLVVLVLSGLNK